MRLLTLLLCTGAMTGGRLCAQGLTLRDAVDSALRDNLDLRLARTVSDSARSETRIARALPNPTYTIIPNTPTQYAGAVALDIGPQRTFRVRASDLGARAVRWDVDESRREVVLAVQRAYYDVLLADARREIVMARRAIMRQLVSADSARVHAGDIPERALIRSGVELVRSDADVARAGVEAQTSRLTLQGLMGITMPDTALLLLATLSSGEPPGDVDVPIETVLAHRPDVTASRTREEQSVAAAGVAASAVIPVPQLSYVRQTSAPFESGHYYALGIGFEVPILNQYRAQRERAAAGRDAAGYARRRVEAQASREVRATRAELHVQRALVRQYRAGVITKLAENVEATRYAYTRGATSLLEVLDALRAQQDVMIDYSTAMHDYWVAAYAFRAAQGNVSPD